MYVHETGRGVSPLISTFEFYERMTEQGGANNHLQRSSGQFQRPGSAHDVYEIEWLAAGRARDQYQGQVTPPGCFISSMRVPSGSAKKMISIVRTRRVEVKAVVLQGFARWSLANANREDSELGVHATPFGGFLRSQVLEVRFRCGFA